MGVLVDTLTISPATGPVSATVIIPGSKSITNRALLIAALADGTSTLTGALDSDDTRYMAGAIRALGLGVEHDEASRTFTVRGGGGAFPNREADLFVGNSGTSMRFLAAAVAIGQGRYRLDGVPRMRERPIDPLLEALADLEVRAWAEDSNGCPPIVIDANGLTGGHVTMPGDKSSQYFSALLMAAPYARQDVTITVEGDLVSKPYMVITAAVMRDFGVETTIDELGWRTFTIPAGQRYRARDYAIEPDASNASYFFAAAAVTGGTIRVPGLGRHSTQGDLGFVRVLEAMGAAVTIADDFTEVTGPTPGTLRGVDLDLNAISDTAQTLAAIAPFATGPTSIRGVGHMRLKETDRVHALATELRKLGQVVDERPDGLRIEPRPVQPATVATYDDHRMAMSFAITGLGARGVTIADPECVRKTFPDFFGRLAAARGDQPAATG